MSRIARREGLLVLAILLGAGSSGFWWMVLRDHGRKEENVRALLDYDGPSLRRMDGAEIPNGRDIVGWANTDKNDEAVDKLLSARGIPFHIDRRTSWGFYPKLGMWVRVSEQDEPEATRLLTTAAEMGLIEKKTEPPRNLEEFDPDEFDSGEWMRGTKTKSTATP